MYIKVKNGQIEKYPYSISQLKSDNPQTSFPDKIPNDRLAEFGVFPVAPTEMPKVDHTKNVVEGKPVFQRSRNIDGTYKADEPSTPENEAWEWSQVWEVVNATQKEIEQRISAMKAEADMKKINAYRDEADPLFFKWQRGEATEQEWRNKVAEIKARFPEV